MNNASAIAKLNDAFRANPILGTTILTAGIRSNSSEDIAYIMNKVRNFKDFNEDIFNGFNACFNCIFIIGCTILSEQIFQNIRRNYRVSFMAEIKIFRKRRHISSYR